MLDAPPPFYIIHAKNLASDIHVIFCNLYKLVLYVGKKIEYLVLLKKFRIIQIFQFEQKSILQALHELYLF